MEEANFGVKVTSAPDNRDYLTHEQLYNEYLKQKKDKR